MTRPMTAVTRAPPFSMEASEHQKSVLREAMAELYDDFEDDTFFRVPEGRGGTFTFGEKSDDPEEAIHHIDGPPRLGTFWCITFVGVYLQVDRRRGGLFHINGWSSSKYMTNHVDSEGGKEIRKQVLERLQHEYTSRGWDRKDDNFAKLVVVCCPRPQVFFDGEKFLEESAKMTGWYVFHGISDFLRYQAAELTKEARQAWDRARKLSGNQLSSDIRLQDRIKKALLTATEVGDLKRASNLEQAAIKVEEHSRLMQKARVLAKTTDQLTILRAHGFVVEQKSGNAVLAKVMRAKEGDVARSLAGRLPFDIGNFLPVSTEVHETESWEFSTEDDTKIFLAEISTQAHAAELATMLKEQKLLSTGTSVG
ncbi:hypothetical protein LTR09_008783 [Extremus antarcticus]|uniref:Uncharacterized protein n=1 Tax=Extremus antarcticus TaxID=702011 RepID=A0AAJ0D9Y4_9PEZI|nr:hypothetical protein LTR09_008783 [Extremus antarcticus]